MVFEFFDACFDLSLARERIVEKNLPYSTMEAVNLQQYLLFVTPSKEAIEQAHLSTIILLSEVMTGEERVYMMIEGFAALAKAIQVGQRMVYTLWLPRDVSREILIKESVVLQKP